MNGWWLSNYMSVLGGAFVVSWIVWVVVSIVLHELAHGWAAMALGDDTPRLTGHMTWNPLVHMGGFSVVALLLLGIAWGQMPVNPGRIRGRHGDALVAFAGPAMNLVLFAVSCVACAVWIAAGEYFQVEDPLYMNLARFFFVGAYLNVVLLIFNLFPAPPLDGSRILASFSKPYERLMTSENGQWIGLGIFIVAFWTASGFLFEFGRTLSGTAIDSMLSVWSLDLATALQSRWLWG